MRKETDQRDEAPSRLATVGPEITRTSRETRPSSSRSGDGRDISGRATGTSSPWCNAQADFIQDSDGMERYSTRPSLSNGMLAGSHEAVVKISSYAHELTT